MGDATEMDFKTVVKKGQHHLRYVESLKERDGKHVLILDFDGFGTDVQPDECLQVTDQLHKMISDEYEATIKEPVYEYMRRTREV
jgi:hypothetical protein